MRKRTVLPSISVIIPAYNEASRLGWILDKIVELSLDAEIIVVNDGSTDNTSEIAIAHQGISLLDHPYHIGSGAAVKTGIRAARGDTILIMDELGSYQPTDIPSLLEGLSRYDMVVGARTADLETSSSCSTLIRRLSNTLASYIVGYPVKDLTSGFRAIRTYVAKNLVDMLPNGISYPIATTIALYCTGHSVYYEPIMTSVCRDHGKVRLLHDGIHSLLNTIMFGILFTPIKVILPVAAVLLVSGGGSAVFSFARVGYFSNLGRLLLLSGVTLAFLSLISQQIASLIVLDSVGEQ